MDMYGNNIPAASGAEYGRQNGGFGAGGFGAPRQAGLDISMLNFEMNILASGGVIEPGLVRMDGASILNEGIDRALTDAKAYQSLDAQKSLGSILF